MSLILQPSNFRAAHCIVKDYSSSIVFVFNCSPDLHSQRLLLVQLHHFNPFHFSQMSRIIWRREDYCRTCSIIHLLLQYKCHLEAVFCRVANPLENLPSGGSADGGCDPWCSKQWSILTVCCLLLPKVISLNGMKM